MAVQQQLQVPKLMYIELETPNRSFVKMRNFLKAKGITNCDFFLALFDRSLAGVDPFDPNLPPMMKARVLQECIRNFWYFLRNVVRIPQQGTPNGVPYELNRGNLAMSFLFMLNFNQFVELPRQTGKTVGACCWYLWCFNFGTSNSQIMFMHKAHQGSKDNLKTVKDLRALLPSYLQMDGSIGNEGKKLKIPDTVIELGHPKNNNRIVTFPSARSVDAANNLGRGKTMPLEYYDEFAFMPFNQVVYEAASPAFATAANNARLHGAPYGILITTTPGDLLTDSGKYAYQIRNSATPFYEDFYDYPIGKMNELRAANTQSDFFLVSYSYQQLGKGADYFANLVKLLVQNWTAIRREVLLEWSEVATDQAFTDEELTQIKSYLKEPIRTIRFGRVGQYVLEIFEEFNLENPPIIGVDVSGATMRDASAITIIDSSTTRAVANLHSNFIPADDLADVLYTIATRYLPNSIICVERNGGFGITVVQRLCKTSAKKNLYWEIKDKVIEEQFDGTKNIKRTAKVKVYGFDSNKQERARLIEILYDRAKYHKDKFIIPILHQEMCGMQVKKNNKVEHSDNTHDDNVFSYLMALHVWYDGNDLLERYNIRKNTIKTDEDVEIVDGDIDSALEKKEKLDLQMLEYDLEEDKSELRSAFEFLEESSNFKTAAQLHDETYLTEIQARDQLFMVNPAARDAYCKQNNINPDTFNMNTMQNGNTIVILPSNLFGAVGDELDTDPGLFEDDFNTNNMQSNQQNLVGNLSHLWNQL